MTPEPIFADALRQLRKKSGLTQAALAARAGLSTEGVSLLERARRTPRATTIQRLADALQLDDDGRERLFSAAVALVVPVTAAPRFTELPVDRSAEVELIATLLRPGSSRLVVLTGPEGVGKTRVAAAAAAAIYPHTPERVGWVSVPAASSPAALTAVLERDPAGRLLRRPGDPLAEHGAEERLLVLDGADSQPETVARICETLLSRSSELRLIVTSRQRLRVPGEVPVEVKPLTLPVPGFHERPRAVMVAEYPRLSRAEQVLLSRISVFSHTFTPQGAAALYGPDTSATAVLGTLSDLVARSLVLHGEDVAGTATFRLHRVAREFAQERLREEPDVQEVHRRHADHLRHEVARTSTRPRDAHRRPWLSRVDRESPNLRDAFDWCLDHEPDAALQLVGDLWPWWQLRGHYAEGRSWAVRALAKATRASARLRAPVLAVAGLLALTQSDYEEAQTYVQEGLDLYSGGRDTSGVSWSLALLGSAAMERGEYTVAAQLHQQALVLARRAGEQPLIGAQLSSLCQIAWLRGDFAHAEDLGRLALETLSPLGDQQAVAGVTTDLGVVARLRGNLSGAHELLHHGHELSRQIGWRAGAAWALHQLGVISRLRGERVRAAHQQSVSLAEHTALGHRWRTTLVLDEMAALSLERDDPKAAVTHLGAAQRLRQEIGALLPPAQQPLRDQALATARALLGPTLRPVDQVAMAGSSA